MQLRGDPTCSWSILSPVTAQPWPIWCERKTGGEGLTLTFPENQALKSITCALNISALIFVLVSDNRSRWFHVKHYPTYLDSRSTRAAATLGTQNVGGEKKHVYWAFLQLIRGPIARQGFWINLHVLKEGVISGCWLADGSGGDQSLKWQALSWPWRPAHYIWVRKPRKRRCLKGQRGILGKGVKQRKQLLARKKRQAGREEGTWSVNQRAMWQQRVRERAQNRPTILTHRASISGR